MKKRIFSLFVVLIICVSGCGTTPSNETPITGATITNTPAPTMSISDIFQTQETPAPVDTESTEVLTEKLELVEASDLASYNAANRMLYMDTAGNQNSLFCIDADTGVVYFVNQKQDYYIYRLKDGKAELAVAMPAKELYCWEGKLYFMIEDYGTYELKDMQDNDIYLYNPEKGSVELVFAAGAMFAQNSDENMDDYQRMTIDENGVYFVGGVCIKPMEDTPNSYFLEFDYRHLPFGEMEPVKDNKQLVYSGWRNYYFSSVMGTDETGFCYYFSLVPREGEFTDRITLEKIDHLSKYFVMEDELILLHEQKVIIRNLVTEEKVEFDLEPVIYELLEKAKGRAFTSKLPQTTALSITTDAIWVVDAAQYVWRIDRQSGEVSGYQLDTSVRINTMYTDGTSVYVLTSYGVEKVVIEEASETDRLLPIVKTELLVGE